MVQDNKCCRLENQSKGLKTVIKIRRGRVKKTIIYSSLKFAPETEYKYMSDVFILSTVLIVGPIFDKNVVHIIILLISINKYKYINVQNRFYQRVELRIYLQRLTTTTYEDFRIKFSSFYWELNVKHTISSYTYIVTICIIFIMIHSTRSERELNARNSIVVFSLSSEDITPTMEMDDNEKLLHGKYAIFIIFHTNEKMTDYYSSTTSYDEHDVRMPKQKSRIKKQKKHEIPIGPYLKSTKTQSTNDANSCIPVI
ncbi:hypothetical protein AGLY_014341 [Aphis glycines]|uniref:Uncharacterized protein n=1 Tax=Aphis glycines TaxID=307491 RepID=A0A6G0T3Q6_APHGL|nr:hypothetical protein AGLY_014341 [Aphis glycines]